MCIKSLILQYPRPDTKQNKLFRSLNMKDLPLHKLVKKSLTQSVLSGLKKIGFKYFAITSNGDVNACYTPPEWYLNPHVSNPFTYLFTTIDKLEPTCEEANWDYLLDNSDKPKYDVTKLGDLYQALLDGHIIKTFITSKSYQLIKFDSKDQKFKVSSAISNSEKQQFKISDKEVSFVAKDLFVNKLFLDNNEIYTPPTERLWVYYTYDKKLHKVVDQGSRFMSIDHPQAIHNTPPVRTVWIKTEEVR